jgi:biotin synthase
VRGPDERTMQRILELVPLVHERDRPQRGRQRRLLTEDQARRFAEGGVHRYNHNLETSRSFFPNVVTTHTWEERQDTCRLVRDHGMELCCGALIGMGETDEQRIELLTQLQELDPTEVPSTSSTRARARRSATEQPVAAWEAIRWIALFRLGPPR